MPEPVAILSTRSLEAAQLQRAQQHYVAIDSIPFIETETIRSEALSEAIGQLQRSEEISAVFTSAKAVEAVAEKCGGAPRWKVWCIAGHTKDQAKDFFGDAAICGTARNAAALAEKMIAAKDGLGRVIFFCGDQRLDDLPETLDKHGVAVEELIVYKTVQTPRSIEKNYQGILFFSPTAVHSFFSENTVPLSTIMFAIGKTTAGVIQSYCTNETIISEWPGIDQMVEKVIHYFTAKQ